MAKVTESQVQNILRSFGVAKNSRSTFNGHWQEVAELIYPDAATFNNANNAHTQGNKNMSKIVESTGVLSNQLLAAGMYSLLTNPTTPWFSLTTSDATLNQSYETSLWLELCTEIMLFEIQRPKAKFITASHEGYLSLGAFGNMVPYLSDNLKNDSLLFTSFPLQECFFSENDEQTPATLYREHRLTPAQLVDKYGQDKVSETVREAYARGKDEPVHVLHVITERAYDPTLVRVAHNLPYASYHLEVETKHVLHESGYHEMPFFATRFFKAAGETYGRGPGMWALPDVQMLMEMKKTTLRGAQIAVTPALQAPDDGFLTPVNLRPGGLNFYRANTQDRIEPIQTGGNPGLGVDLIQDTRQLIREAFYIDQMQLGFGPQMTATEVMQRTEEKLRMMGPLLGRLQAEFLGPMIERAFGILLRAGKLPAPPEEVRAKGATLKITYTSSLARAQEQVEANGFMRLLELVTPVINMAPEAVDNFDSDNIIRGLGDMFSISKTFFKKQEVVAANRAERQKAQRAQMEAELMQKAAMSADAGTRAMVNAKEAEVPLEELV